MPDGVIPIKQCRINKVYLNYAHGFFYNDKSDELYVATLFTNKDNILTTNPDTAKGSIAIFSNYSTLNGVKPPTRHLFGDSTGFKQPHSCWLDTTRDILYVANTLGEDIRVFDSASKVDGNTKPSRIISSGLWGRPVHIFIDEKHDVMFVACQADSGKPQQIVIYSNASKLDSTRNPNLRIIGSNTRFDRKGYNLNVSWYNSDKKLLAVVVQNNELLLFDINGLDLSTAPTTDFNLTPRVININQNPDNSDSLNWKLNGIFWNTKKDKMYLSIGFDSSGVRSGSPPNKINVYSDLTDTSKKGHITPERVIAWSNAYTYYPSQSVWVSDWIETNIIDFSPKKTIYIYPNPSTNGMFYLNNENRHTGTYSIVNTLGKTIKQGKIAIGNNELSLEVHSPPGVYLIKCEIGRNLCSEKLIYR